MMRTIQDTINALTRPFLKHRIKVVPQRDPNADGFWVDCGFHQFPREMTFREHSSRLHHFCPSDHFIVGVEST